MRPHLTDVRWPYWLLIAAWVCANVPATVMTGTFRWAGGAGHFSHSSQLKQSVASLLAGESSIQPEHDGGTHCGLPEAPAVERPVKKLHLAVAPGTPALWGELSPPARPMAALQVVAAPPRDVPHPPPRAA